MLRGLQDARKRSCFPFSATALKIHVSPKTKEILDTFGTFELICRGEVILKVSYLDMWFFLQFYRDILYFAFYLANPTVASFFENEKIGPVWVVSSEIVKCSLKVAKMLAKRMIIARTRPSCDLVSQIATYNVNLFVPVHPCTVFCKLIFIFAI